MFFLNSPFYQIFFKDGYYQIPKKIPYSVHLKRTPNDKYALFHQIDLMRNPTKGRLTFLQVNEMYQISETDFTVELYGYNDDLYSPDKLNDSKFYNTKAKNIKGYSFNSHYLFLKAKIRKVQNDEYIVLEIKIQFTGELLVRGSRRLQNHDFFFKLLITGDHFTEGILKTIPVNKKTESNILKKENIVSIDKKLWKKLNMFLSKLYQYDIAFFKENELSDDEMIKFAVIYNLSNLPENIKEVIDDRKYSKKVSAKDVHNVIKKYFGKDFTNDKTITVFQDSVFDDYKILFKDNFYYIPQVWYQISLYEGPGRFYVERIVDLILNPCPYQLKILQVDKV